MHFTFQTMSFLGFASQLLSLSFSHIYFGSQIFGLHTRAIVPAVTNKSAWIKQILSLAAYVSIDDKSTLPFRLLSSTGSESKQQK